MYRKLHQKILTLQHQKQKETGRFKRKLEAAKQKLRNLISDLQKQKQRSAKKKQMIAGLAVKIPANVDKLGSLWINWQFMNKLTGLQLLKNLYLDLHQKIIDLVRVGAGAGLHRQTDVLNSCKTLDDLHTAQRKECYVLSRNAL